MSSLGALSSRHIGCWRDGADCCWCCVDEALPLIRKYLDLLHLPIERVGFRGHFGSFEDADARADSVDLWKQAVLPNRVARIGVSRYPDRGGQRGELLDYP